MQDELEANISRLQPNTSYAISVSANNTLGWGEEAQGSIRTMPRMTEQLFNVTEVKSKAFTVTVKRRATHKQLQCDMSWNANGIRTFNTTQKRKRLPGLTPNTQYTIHCVAKDEDACVQQTRKITTGKNRELLPSRHYDLKG